MTETFTIAVVFTDIKLNVYHTFLSTLQLMDRSSDYEDQSFQDVSDDEPVKIKRKEDKKQRTFTLVRKSLIVMRSSGDKDGKSYKGKPLYKGDKPINVAKAIFADMIDNAFGNRCEVTFEIQEMVDDKPKGKPRKYQGVSMIGDKKSKGYETKVNFVKQSKKFEESDYEEIVPALIIKEKVIPPKKRP